MKNWILFLLLSFYSLCTFAKNNPNVDYGQNEFNLGFSDTPRFYLRLPTLPRPLFWNSPQTSQTAGQFRFTHLFYARKFFSLGAGLSLAGLQIPSESIATFSAFVEVRLWLLYAPQFRAYIMYSLAGPTEITARRFGHAYFSENFLFQDYLGFGFQFGKKQALNLEAYTVHYSNGDIFAVNSGIQIPFMVSLGYSFP